MPVDRFKNLLLLRRLHSDGLECLSCSAVRADKRFVVLSGKRRSAVVGPAAQGADRHPAHIIILHIRIPPCIYRRRQPGRFYQSRRCRTLPGKSSCRDCLESQSACPHALCRQKLSPSCASPCGCLCTEARCPFCSRNWGIPHSGRGRLHPQPSPPRLPREPCRRRIPRS